jgi:hypothetical protein
MNFLFQLEYNEKYNCHNTHNDWSSTLSEIGGRYYNVIQRI